MSFYREGEIEGERSRQGGKDKDRAREGKRYVREREREITCRSSRKEMESIAGGGVARRDWER